MPNRYGPISGLRPSYVESAGFASSAFLVGTSVPISAFRSLTLCSSSSILVPISSSAVQLKKTEYSSPKCDDVSDPLSDFIRKIPREE
ncbi:hypothetical protein OsI_31141 [Oryza sativa Indica Group]|uniref:Uncharacterized protein n=1 Tax=Oryza sativa subsp. indica TaxID=39946 RepID=B8BEY9_ORYSI|nr:hypothetical protein OsI_31141 [Oryza sativa Indica Group]